MTHTSPLVKQIAAGIQEKKGQNILIVDLRETEGAVAQYFVICEGNSPTQVEAIAESVDERCRKDLGERPIGVAGLGLSQWVAIDYADVMVHIFQPEARAFYDLENLWQDAKLTRLPNVE